MLTRKGAVVAASLVGMAAIAALARAWVLAVATVPLFVALAVGFLGSLGPARPCVADARVAGTRHLAGDVTRVDVTLHGNGRPGRFAEVAVDVPAATSVDRGAAVFLARVPGRDDVRTRFDLRLPVRGRYNLGGVIVRERFPFGLFRRTRRVNAGAPFVVLPGRELLDPLPTTRPQDRLRFGAFHAGRRGAGREFHGLRGYQPGDAVDTVNWKQTAKRSREPVRNPVTGRVEVRMRHGPVVNEYEHEAPANVIIVVDAREDANVGAGYHSTLEAAIRAAVSVSARATEDRYHVGLVVLGSRITWIHPKAGRRQHEDVIEHLLDVTPGGRYPIPDALALLPATVLPRGATVVLVTPPHVDASLPDAVQGLAARDARPVVIAVSGASAEAASERFGAIGDAGARIIRLGRAAFLGDVRRAGAVVVDWDVREPLARAFTGTKGHAIRGGTRS